MTSVLVAYATKYGSTQEVAEAIAATLRDAGLEADARAAREVRDLAGYSAVVLGGALYYFMWHGDARRFLSRHHKALAHLPVAIFALGPFGNSEQELEEARRPVDRVLERQDWLVPVAVTVFGGRHDPERLRFPDSNPAMKNMPASDARDWDAIREWAASLVPRLTGD